MLATTAYKSDLHRMSCKTLDGSGLCPISKFFSKLYILSSRHNELLTALCILNHISYLYVSSQKTYPASRLVHLLRKWPLTSRCLLWAIIHLLLPSPYCMKITCSYICLPYKDSNSLRTKMTSLQHPLCLAHTRCSAICSIY